MTRRQALAWAILAIFVVPILQACSSPANGDRDVMTPEQVKAHKLKKEKHEGGD